MSRKKETFLKYTYFCNDEYIYRKTYMQHVDLQKINVPWYCVILLEQNSNKNVSTYVGSVQDMQKLGQLALKFQRHQGVITLICIHVVMRIQYLYLFKFFSIYYCIHACICVLPIKLIIDMMKKLHDGNNLLLTYLRCKNMYFILMDIDLFTQ